MPENLAVAMELRAWWVEYQVGTLHSYAARILEPVAAALRRDPVEWMAEVLKRIGLDECR